MIIGEDGGHSGKYSYLRDMVYTSVKKYLTLFLTYNFFLSMVFRKYGGGMGGK